MLFKLKLQDGDSEKQTHLMKFLTVGIKLDGDMLVEKVILQVLTAACMKLVVF
jgi:hypothetical protein